MMNPIEKIKEWFYNEPESVQGDLGMMGILLPTLNPIPDVPDPLMIDKVKFLPDEPNDRFIAILNADPNSIEEEIALKAMTIVSLIESVTATRDNESDWDEIYNRNLDFAARKKEKGYSTEIEDRFFENFEERKALWIDVGRRWNNFRNAEVSPKLISGWYHDEVLKRFSARNKK
jgi:hypothetical protein